MQEYKRKLTAIFSADVAGYSRLMGDDEAATVETLTAYREVMYSLIRQHRGRVVDSPGDNMLAEFASVVDAAQCSVAIQKEIQSRNNSLPENRRMQFRIGINLGDVIEEGDRIYGDGVNIAARLESIAEPGGICISKTAFDHIESKLPLGYEFIGEQTVKNISKPVYAYRVIMDPRVVSGNWFNKVLKRSSRTRNIVIAAGIVICIMVIIGFSGILTRFGGSQTDQNRDQGPSIVILPFKNMSGDPDQEAFSDGITEELIHSLARIDGLRVISQTTSFSYKGKNLPISIIANDLSVTHVLEGSVRKDVNKIRITVQLISVADDAHLLSETYDREMKDIFVIQDEIAKAVVAKLKIRLLGDEYEKEGEVSIVGHERRSGINVTVNDDEIIRGGLLATGLNIKMAGSVKGGLEAYGGHVIISGTSQDTVNFWGGDVTLSGNFSDKVKGSAGNLVISGTFEKDLEVDAKHIKIAPEAVIKGEFIYSGKLERENGSQIIGKIKQLNKTNVAPWSFSYKDKEKNTLLYLLGPVYWDINIIILAVFIYFLFPIQNKKILSTISESPYIKSIFKGLLLFIAASFIIPISIITVVGIPFAVICICILTVIIFSGPVYGCLWLGKNLLRLFKVSFFDNYFISLLTGIIVIELLSMIPFVGWLPKGIFFLLGVNAVRYVTWTALKNAKINSEAE